MIDPFAFKFNLENCEMSYPGELDFFIDCEEEDLYSKTNCLNFPEPQVFEKLDIPQEGIINFEPEIYQDEIANSILSIELKSDTNVKDDQIKEIKQEIISTKEETYKSEDSVDDLSVREDLTSDLESTILNTLSKLKEQQTQIDDGTYIRNGPGRKRKYGPRTSSQLKDLAKAYLRESIGPIISNKRCKNRKDALITNYVRAVKKLTYHLVEMCAAKNMYKRNEVSRYLIAFSESHSSFLFSIEACHDIDLVKSFIEYVVIYFPLDKAHDLIDLLIKQNYRDQDFLKSQADILEKRDNTSKKNIKKWTDNSPTFRLIFKLALEVLEEEGFSSTKVGEHLTKITKYFLTSQ